MSIIDNFNNIKQEIDAFQNIKKKFLLSRFKTFEMSHMRAVDQSWS